MQLPSFLVQRFCLQCEKPFVTYISRINAGRGNYCSRECSFLSKRISIEKRLWEALYRTNKSGCWEWFGQVDEDGYGKIKFKGKTWRTHRLAWELTNGPIPDGLCVLHKCDNPRCCNPGHLFLGDNEENNRDRHQKGRTASGERNGGAKLNWNKVEEMRLLYRSGNYTQRKLATRFEVSMATVDRIVSGRYWKPQKNLAA